MGAVWRQMLAIMISIPLATLASLIFTMMSSAGVPLRHIQEISGHNDLGTLQRESGRVEVTPEQRKKAVSVIGF